MHRNLTLLLGAALTLAWSSAARAQRDFSQVEIQSELVAEGIYMLRGAGGNIGVSAGTDGVFLVDDQYAPLNDKIRAAVARISNRPIRFVINTHWHSDHTGGNESLAGDGTVVVAHDNVRRRMSTEQFVAAVGSKVEPSPPGALPIVTFSDTVTFHLNGDEASVVHVPHAHTDGDALIFFRKANVVHLGDCFWSSGYPFIDVSSGGSIGGMIAAVDAALARSRPGARFVPGHGPLGDRAALEEYREMLVTIRNRVRELAAAGKNLEEIQSAKPSRAYDAKWGNGWIKPAQFVEFVHAGI